uniref:High mobility group nucleosomal binding domain 4 n=1 Tax=Bos taurus TaxID=9913 RepID=A0AAA9TE66_BOVIN
MSHRGDQHGCLLNLPFQNRSPGQKRPLQRRERSWPKGERGKQKSARMGTTLRKTEMPLQSSHRKQKALGMPNEVYLFDSSVLLVTLLFEILFLNQIL